MTGYGRGAIVILLLLQGSSLTAGQTATHASETTLRAALISGYDQTVRPYTPTYVDMTYFLRSVQSLDIATQQLSHTAFLGIMWHDPRLVWDSTAYSNITSLDINWTWRPMFHISNSVDSVDMIGSDNDVARVTVFNNGSLLWQFTMIPTTSCDVNILYFPYDTQECSVYLVFFGHDYENNFIFNLSNTKIDTEYYLENQEWVLDSSSLQPTGSLTCCPQTTMSYITAKVKFKRLHAFYLNTILIPTILLSICLVWPFYLPTESGDRLGFALTILLTYTVVLSSTSAFLPTMSKQVSYISTYLLGVLVMCSIAVCNVALFVKFSHLETPPPGVVKTFYRKMKPIVFLECITRQRRKVGDQILAVASVDSEKPPAIDEKVREDPKASPSDEEEITWVKVVSVMDRVCFVMYSLAVFVLDVILMSVLSSG